MLTSESNIAVFGDVDPGIQYIPRPAAYAVILDPNGRIAAVKGSDRYFLPGGGSLRGETPEQTVAREVREELARNVWIIRRVGEAIQYFFADNLYYRMDAAFFYAEFTGEPSGVGEHELYWLELRELEQNFFHQCHAWAVGQVFPLRRVEPGSDS